LRYAAAQSAGFDFYIGPAGSDSNPGTLDQPWSINALNTKWASYAGKRVGLLNGNYNLRRLGVTYIDNWSSSMLLVAAGSSASRTVIQSVEPQGAVIDADYQNQPSPYRKNGVIGCSNGGYVTIDGLKIVNAGYRAIQISNGTGYIVQNCHILNQLYAAPAIGASENSAAIELLTGTTSALIRNNRIEGCGAPADANRHAAIQAFDSTNTTVEFNTIIGGSSGQNGVHFKNTGNRGITIRYNYIDMRYCSGGSVAIRVNDVGTTPCEIHNNIFVALEPVVWEGPIVQRTTLRNNTIVGVTGFGAAGVTINSASGAGELNFFNNIVSRTAIGWRGDANFPSSGRGTIDFNFYDNTPTVVFSLAPSASGGSFTGLPAWRSATTHDASSLGEADPGFAAAGSEALRYQLASGSVCRNAGRVGGTRDGSVIDIGAWGGATIVGSSFDSQGPDVAPRPPSSVVAE
jgi:hypothetical protein